MPACASFIIPVLNEQAGIVPLLVGLRRQYPDAELLVVDGGSTDQTVAQAMPHCDQLLVTEAGRARQMNLGAKAASRQYLFFLHADTRPGISADELDACLACAPVWGFCRVGLSSPRPAFRVIESAMNIRSRLTQVATGDQMLFASAVMFARIHGFDSIPLMEDVAFSKRARRICAPFIIAQPVQTSSRRWEERGVVRTVVQMWCLRLAYVLGVSPQRLWYHYYGS
jgi:rSAM/selenodomain-associated transferase 2